MQPGVKPGDTTYCPVSGVVFEVKPTTARRYIGGGRTLVFCCETCADHFVENAPRILAARGISP